MIKILFFSRGRGRGHAIPDVAIANDLLRSAADLKLQFVSYSTGGETIRECGYHVRDLCLPENNSFLETLILCVQVIREVEPALIVAHEEFCVPVAAKICKIPCIFLIDWFPLKESIWVDCLRYSETIIFLDDPGYFDEPEFLREKIHYVGPVLRDITLSRADRVSARKDLGLSCEQPIILVLPSGSVTASEEKAPIFTLISQAIQLIDRPITTIWVLSETEQEMIKTQSKHVTDALFVRPRLDIERLMIAADIAITKATRKTTLELNALGIPSISISYGLNPIDDFRVPHIKTNRALRARGLSAHTLSAHIVQKLQTLSAESEITQSHSNGKGAAVQIIQEYIDAVRSAR
jgi:UDP-N-acetylglucosamine:LPS N-acetylglucosamine transferase